MVGQSGKKWRGGLQADALLPSHSPWCFTLAFQALEDLDVGGNQLAALPDALGALGSLKYLNAMNNQVCLADGVFDCKYSPV